MRPKKKKKTRRPASAAAEPKDGSSTVASALLPRGISDRLILDQVDQILPGNALLVLITGTALAKHLTNARPEVAWKIFTCEHFYMTAAINALNEEPTSEAAAAAQIDLFCTPDLPEGEFDTAIFPTDSRGSSELTRDLLQAIARQLKPLGRLIISTNNAKDHWLHEHLKEIFGRTTVIRDDRGICYIARKRETPSKLKDFRCEFAFRDGERLIKCASRPGVFSHRRVDAGARALIRSMNLLAEPEAKKFKAPRRIVEMGCGCGSVSTAAALRYPAATVLAVDSHARAVQATECTASLNDAKNVHVLLTSDGNIPDPGTWDLFLCNPPYYSDFRISELFLQSAYEALRRGGRVHLVTKLTDWHHNRMIEIFANGTVHTFGEYQVIVSTR